MTWVYSTTDTAWSGSFNRSNYVSQTFTATAGQTSFTVTGGYLPTLIEVYQNGVLLVNGSDVTVTSGTVVVLATGAIVGDIIQVIGNQTFNAAAIDASAITSGTLPVARGGTGATALTANSVLLGNNGSALQTVSPGTAGNVLVSNGTTWTSATAPVINVQSFDASGTFTKPAGYSASSRVFIQAWGAGGSGGRGNGSTTAGCGAGGGAYSERWVPLSALGSTETVTVGAGGAAISSGTTGNVGGNTSFGSFLTAYGGGGGGAGPTTAGGGGGQISAGSTANATPGRPWDISGDGYTPLGGLGEDGFWGGAGGGSCTSGTNITNGQIPGSSYLGGGGGGGSGTGTGGSAAGGSGVASGGNGGAGSSTGTATSGSQPAGGGGGTSTGTSGAGGAGRVIVTVFPA